MQNKKINFSDLFLFETSWEVCNKIGGIYTVLSTKAAELKKQFGDNLIFIGPDLWDSEHPSPDFIERKTLLKSASSKLNLPDGISIRIGRWQVPGNPIAVLVKFDSLFPGMNDIYGQMWQDFQVDSLHAYGDYTTSCAFAVAAAKVIIALSRHLKISATTILAHFDEWTTGMGLLYIKKNLPSAATIFTTHATSIGRSISGNGKPLYDYFKNYNGDQMAQELNMESKHSLETKAAINADCFTTVSDVTAAECEQLLGVTPQVITPNGFNADFVPKEKQYIAERESARRKLLKTASNLTGKDFDDSTFIVATSGRNEYRNKGLDLYIDSLVKLGQSNVDDKQVLALILVPAWVDAPNDGLINKSTTEDNEIIVWPTFSTHRLNNENDDPIFQRLLQLQSNMQESSVSFVYVPCYLDSNDGVINISYYNLMPGIDATVFPSYYEPWGYTPLESVAFGIPTITTDKSGFGQWVEHNFNPDIMSSGVKVVPRTDSNYDSAAETIADTLIDMTNYTDSQSRQARNAARKTASEASWSLFIKYYDEAYLYALKTASLRNKA